MLPCKCHGLLSLDRHSLMSQTHFWEGSGELCPSHICCTVQCGPIMLQYFGTWQCFSRNNNQDKNPRHLPHCRSYKSTSPREACMHTFHSYFISALLTLGAHALRGLRYLVSVCVCVYVCVCVCVLLNISLFTWLFVPPTILTFLPVGEGGKI